MLNRRMSFTIPVTCLVVKILLIHERKIFCEIIFENNIIRFKYIQSKKQQLRFLDDYLVLFLFYNETLKLFIRYIYWINFLL